MLMLFLSMLLSYTPFLYVFYPTSYSFSSIFTSSAHNTVESIRKHSFIELMSAFDVPLLLFHTPKFPLDLSSQSIYIVHGQAGKQFTNLRQDISKV